MCALGCLNNPPTRPTRLAHLHRRFHGRHDRLRLIRQNRTNRTIVATAILTLLHQSSSRQGVTKYWSQSTFELSESLGKTPNPEGSDWFAKARHPNRLDCRQTLQGVNYCRKPTALDFQAVAVSRKSQAPRA